MRCCHVSRFHIFNSIALYYCYVYVFFCLCCSSWYENEANNFIGKNDNKKISPLLKIFYILFPFHLQDSLLLFFRHNLASMVFININSKKNFFSIHIVYRFISRKILQYRSCQGMKRNEDKYSGSGNFLFALKSIAECSSNNRETWYDFQKKVLMILIRHTQKHKKQFLFFDLKEIETFLFLALKNQLCD